MKIDYPFSIYDLKIRLSRKPCFGECPVYNLTILGSGKGFFEGIKYVPNLGEAEFEIPRNEVISIFKYALDIDFFAMPNKFETKPIISVNFRDQICKQERSVFDFAEFEITIEIENNSKSVYASSVTAPSRLISFAEFIDDACKKKI